MGIWKRLLIRKPRALEFGSGLSEELSKVLRVHLRQAGRHYKLVPRMFVRQCQGLFEKEIPHIAGIVADYASRRDPCNQVCQDPESGIYMVISIFPWTTVETVRYLAETSSEPSFGYVAMMTKLFFNNWPSPGLTHYFHVILCLGDDKLTMHTSMGDYGGHPKASRSFTVLPIELLNRHERHLTGL